MNQTPLQEAPTQNNLNDIGSNNYSEEKSHAPNIENLSESELFFLIQALRFANSIHEQRQESITITPTIRSRIYTAVSKLDKRKHIIDCDYPINKALEKLGVIKHNQKYNLKNEKKLSILTFQTAKEKKNFSPLSKKSSH